MSIRKEYVSIKITRIFLKIIGFWVTKNRKEEIILNCCRIYSAQAIIGATITQVMEFFIYNENVSDVTYWLCSSMPIVVVTIKFCIFFYKRREIVDILNYTNKHIWFKQYDKDDQEIMDTANKEATYIICFFMFLIYSIMTCYAVTPIIENIGQPKNDRKFPFNGIAAFLDDESTNSPNFEIIFTVEVMPMLHIGILYCCFDNLLFVLSTFLVGQFKMLQRQLTNICNSLNMDSEKSRQEISDKLKILVEHHKSLTIYVSRLEDIFTVILFCQLCMSSILICVSGFQVFLVNLSTIKGMIFKFHLSAGVFQILSVTWSSNNIITESDAIAYSSYDMLWYCIPYDKHGKSIRQAVKTIIMRSSRSCYLSAAGFFPVSLASFLSVMSKTLSYFTLLRQFL